MRKEDYMSENEARKSEKSRRGFLKGLAAGAAVIGATPIMAKAAQKGGNLQVWSCGGLAEAMMPAHVQYHAETDVNVAYTGARAGALGKSLLDGNGHTDVFCGRQLDLAKQLRKGGKMEFFKPLCFTSYVIVVPKGNPWKIQSLEDMAKPGIPVAMSPKASSPGGQAVTNLVKNARLTDQIMANVLDKDATCVLRTVVKVTGGEAAAMIVERRITKMKLFGPYLDIVEIPFEFYPKGPLTFTVGVMTDAHDKDLANNYLNWIISPEGQQHFENAGFISAYTPQGQELVEKLGVKDEN